MKLHSIVWVLYIFGQSRAFTINNTIDPSLSLSLDLDSNPLGLTLLKDDTAVISGQIGGTQTLTTTHCLDGAVSCEVHSDGGILLIESIDGGFFLRWESENVSTVFQDCFDLNSTDTHWYGGPEKWQAEWPVENIVFSNRLYTTIKTDNGAVGERYWLNSKGGYIFIGDEVPLYLEQNSVIPGSICYIAKTSGPYVGRTSVVLEYNLVARNNTQEAHLHAVNNFLGKPSEHPDEWIIRNPIWTTWTKYKKDINDDKVVEFATSIADHGFTGQIEIDDYWETCYGSLTFNDVQFPNINQTVQTLKDLNFTVTLWTHPFVNADCDEPNTYGETNGLFVVSNDGGDETNWWDGNDAHYIDFTKEEARTWFSDRLNLLKELHGFDAFKFDAGESDYPPVNPVLSTDVNQSPNSITSSYIRTCATFGGLIEVRSAWRTQDLPIFVRMLDKDSRWTGDNGLQALIPSLLQFNIMGYVYTLPDIIGGNAYGDHASAELLVRWTQANTFMAAMQFSDLPWEITSDDFDAVAIVRKFVDLHAQYADVILNAMNNTIETGTPVNPPIWWLDPENEDALTSSDEYLLGDQILVAPIVQEGGVTRDIVLPRGSWLDGNNGTVYEGSQILRDYPAPIDVLPFFIRQ